MQIMSSNNKHNKLELGKRTHEFSINVQSRTENDGTKM